jgi:MYXO-CTERM domain-containing protein
MNWKNASSALAAGVATLLATGAAWATDYCYDKACPTAGDACHAGVCVPKDKVCKTDAGCKAWQKCDFTCPGGGVATSGGGTTTPGSTGCASSDGDACAAQDGGSAGGAPMPVDGGSSDPGFKENGDTASGDVSQPPPCPKDEGVCVVDLKKVPTQPGCADFCGAVVKCDFMGGKNSSGGSGGGPTDPPPQASDASSGMPAMPDAGSAPAKDTSAASDAGSSDQAYPDASGVQPPPDSDNGEAAKAELEQCIQFCSVWKLENVAQPEFTSLAQCIAGKQNDCATLEAACKTQGEAFSQAIEKDMGWSLGLSIGFGEATSQAGTDKNADAGATGNASDGSTSAPRNPDASQASDAGTTPPAAGGGNSGSSSGCTASASSSASPWALGLLAIFGLATIVRRRVRA